MQKRIRVEGSAEMEIHHFIMKPINIICSFRTFGSNVTHRHTHTSCTDMWDSSTSIF